MNAFGLILVAVGAFWAVGAISNREWFINWKWFIHSRKARLMIPIFTRTRARAFYGLLGFALVVLGIFTTLGVVELESW